MSESKPFKYGDLVWAKMKGYPPWPAKVCEPGRLVHKKPKTLDKNSHAVFFFGTRNFSWIEDGNLKHYEDHKDLLKVTKTPAFKKAVGEIEEFIASGESTVIEENTLDQGGEDNMDLEEAEAAPETPRVKGKPGRKKKMSLETNGDSTEDSYSDVPKKRKTMEDGHAGPSRPSVGRKSAAHNLVNRIHGEISAPRKPIDVTTVSQMLKDKNITPSTYKFGFLGVGIMGSGMIKNLLNSGHHVSIWNRTPDKCEPFTKIGADQVMTPSDVVGASDITFSCVSDPTAAKEMVFGNCGALTEIDATKNYVEMTSLDSEASQDIADAIQGKGGRYLEAQIQGNMEQAENGTLVIIAAGNKSLYDECESAFRAIAKHSFFVGPTGTACKINLILQMLSGITIAGAAEALTLADRAGLNPKDVFSILKETNIASPLLLEKGDSMANDKIEVKFPLTHMQKDINLALQLGHACDQSLPVASAANESYKHAKRLGYGSGDVAAVLYHSRF